VSRRFRAASLGAVFLLLVPAHARAEFAEGDQVVTTENTDLRGSDGTTKTVKAAMPLVVEAADGTSLRVKEAPDGVSGLIDPEKVVASDKALDYFTARIKQNPKDARAYEIRGDYYCFVTS
jgi:predicted amino acid dehydrogenase